MTTLYAFPPTRSNRAQWALEELGLPYDSHIVNLEGGEQNASEHLSRHPLGVVPVLETGQYRLFESVAIVMQLIDENPGLGLAPEPGTPERAQYYQWCVYAPAEMDCRLMEYFDNKLRPLYAMRPPGRQYNLEAAEQGKYQFSLRANAVSKVLEKQDYILGDVFSGADIAVGHSCFMAKLMGLIGEYPVLEAYYDRLNQRPAHRKVYGVAGG